ncbi:MAG: hypothetical protein ACI9MF_002900, partial [Gammaproteobacteria bacterium]
ALNLSADGKADRQGPQFIPWLMPPVCQKETVSTPDLGYSSLINNKKGNASWKH